jgi:hypothetical protein
MRRFDAREQACLAFLSALYIRSAGDARQGVPYEALVDTLGVRRSRDETASTRASTGRRGGPDRRASDDHGGRPIIDHAQRWSRQETIGMTPQGFGSWRTSSRSLTRHLPTHRRPLTTPPRSRVCTPQTHRDHRWRAPHARHGG